MVQPSDSTIDALIPILRKAKSPPSTEFIREILMAFVNGNALEKRSGSNLSDPNSIANFLGIYEATENFVFTVASLNQKILLPTTCVAQKNNLETASILSVLPFSVAPEKAAAATKFRENTWCFNCYQYGHTWYNCIINCTLQDCPRTTSLETNGQPAIPAHPAKCCPLRNCHKKSKAYLKSKTVGRAAILNNLSATPPALSDVLTPKTYLDAAKSADSSPNATAAKIAAVLSSVEAKPRVQEKPKTTAAAAAAAAATYSA